MSEEHYPARSVGNYDIGGFDLIKFIELLIKLSNNENLDFKKTYLTRHI